MNDWNYTTENDGYTQQCLRGGVSHPSLGKVFGGSSSIDAMLYSQGDPGNYDKWANITKESAWKWKNVQRLFKKVEKFEDSQLIKNIDPHHGYNGKVKLVKDLRPVMNKYLNSFKDIGKNVVPDINSDNRLGYTRAVYYIADQMRQNSALTYIYPIRNRTNLIVLRKTQVTKILFNTSKRAVGVEAVSLENNKKLVFKARKEIIVAGGTYNTATLLQLSGIGPKRLLNNFNIPLISDLPVGNNLQNHVATVINYATKKSCQPFVNEKHNIHDFPIATFVGYNALDNSETPEYRSVSYVNPYSPDKMLLQILGFRYGYEYDIVDSMYNKSMGYEHLLTFIDALNPKSKGRVEIRSKNPFDKPIIHTGYFSEDVDLEEMMKYVRDLIKVGESSFFKEVGAAVIDPTNGKCGKMDLNDDEFLRCYILCMMVPRDQETGTAAMGVVVDGRLRVKGVSCLRVADASVMPTPISGSKTVPTMMIAENVAEMIKEDANKETFK